MKVHVFHGSATLDPRRTTLKTRSLLGTACCAEYPAGTRYQIVRARFVADGAAVSTLTDATLADDPKSCADAQIVKKITMKI